MVGGLTSMYRNSRSEKEASILVMKGCPETWARISRSWRTWSICRSLMTALREQRRALLTLGCSATGWNGRTYPLSFLIS